MNSYSGHAPGHVRQAFEDAVEAMIKWHGSGREPTVDFEINYEPRPITLAQACTLVSRCTDCLPGWIADELSEHGLKTRTYAAGARAMRVWLRERRSQLVA
jgi:hypothetical protein